MSTLDVTPPEGDLARTVELPAEVFDVQVNVPLIHQVVVAQLAAARQGTHDTKTRGEVRGGGRKPYRQKGTGRARQGSSRAPQFTGGGTVFGPTPRNYAQKTPKKMKVAALRGALSDRARGDRLHVVSGLVPGDVPSTRLAVRALARITERRHVLVVADRSDELTWKSLRNAPNVHLIAPGQLNTYDVLVSDDVVFTEGAYAAFLAGPPKGRAGASPFGEQLAGADELSDLAAAVDTLAPGPTDAGGAHPDTSSQTDTGATTSQTDSDQTDSDQTDSDQTNQTDIQEASVSETPANEAAKADADEITGSDQ
jgi:large subunit ribosomal protein L4